MKKITNLTIATFNTQGILALSFKYFKKCRVVADYFNTQQIDVINFQEVFFYHHFRYLKRTLTDFPYSVYKPSIFGPMAGLVTFSKYPLKFETYKSFSKTGNVWNKSIISILSRKGYLLSRLKNSNLYILNTHFSANFSNDWNTENQDTKILKKQIQELRSLILKLPGRSIITGDFNIHKKSFLYKLLIKNGLQDVFKTVYKTTHRGDMFVSSKNNLQVDYILFSGKHIKVRDKKFIFDQKVRINGNKKRFISDHVGLQAILLIDN